MGICPFIIRYLKLGVKFIVVFTNYVMVMDLGLFNKGPVMELSVKGMSCNHCVMRVSKALEDVPGVKKVDVDLNKGRAKVFLTNEGAVSNDQLISAVKHAGYEASASQ